MNGKRLIKLFGFFLAAAAATSVAMAQATFIIPHFVADELEGSLPQLMSVDLFGTEIVVSNPSQEEVPVAISAFDDQGDPLSANITGPQAVPPGGLGRYRITAPGLASGWLRVSTGERAIVRGSIRLIRVEALGVPPIGVTRLMDTDANPTDAFTNASVPVAFVYSGDSTGVAIVYPAADGAAPNSVSLTLRDSAGAILGSAEIQVPPNGRRAFLIQDLFPQIVQVGFDGTLEVSAVSPVCGTTIEYQAIPVVWRTVDFGVAP